MQYTGPNGPCTCGSGTKYKKCCGPRGGLTKIEYAEEQAHREERARDRASRPRNSSAFPSMLAFAVMGQSAMSSCPPPSVASRRGREANDQHNH